MKLRHHVLLALMTSVAATGCGGSSDLPELATVAGTVTLDQQPLSNATVMFQPDKGRASYGQTDSSGRYELEYGAGSPGAIIGNHKVRIRTRVDGEDGQPPVTPEKLPKKYHEATELAAEVKPGENTHNFDLKSR